MERVRLAKIWRKQSGMIGAEALLLRDVPEGVSTDEIHNRPILDGSRRGWNCQSHPPRQAAICAASLTVSTIPMSCHSSRTYGGGHLSGREYDRCRDLVMIPWFSMARTIKGSTARDARGPVEVQR